MNISPDNLYLIENNGSGNCWYYSISHHLHSNFNQHKRIRLKIANRLTQRAIEMPMVTTNNNEGQFLPIFIYAQNVYKDGEWGGDAEISMVSLIYNDIRIAIYRLINNTQSNEILGYEYINTYGDINIYKYSNFD